MVDVNEQNDRIAVNTRNGLMAMDLTALNKVVGNASKPNHPGACEKMKPVSIRRRVGIAIKSLLHTGV
jgi:hypothetical protein